MTHRADEIGAFVARADALLVNLGTFDAERREATAAAHRASPTRPACPGCSIRCSSTARRRARPMRKSLVAQKPRRDAAQRRGVRGAVGRRGADDAALARYARDTRAVVALTGDGRPGHRRRAARRDRQRPSADGARDRDGLRGLGAGRRRSSRSRAMRWRRPRRRCCASASPARSRASARAGPGSFRGRRSSMRSMRSTATTLIAKARVS